MRTAIVIPAYQEARTIRDIATRACEVCPRVFVVDDGSTDDTLRRLDGVPVTLLRHATNHGKAAALWTGFAAARAAGVGVVVTLDGDGQHRPEDVPRLVAAAQRHPHRVVLAARVRRREHAPRARRAANGVADFWLSWAAGHPIVDSQSGQRAYPAELLRALLRDGTPRHDRHAAFTLESEILIAAARRGYETIAVPIDSVYLANGRPSHFRPVRDIARIVRMVAGHLVATKLNPHGLWRALSEAPVILPAPPAGSTMPMGDTASRHGG